MRSRKRALTFFELIVVVAIIGALIALLGPISRGGGAREAALRNQCKNNLKQIVIALLNYEAKHGTLPPAFTQDGEGNRLHSWRTLILPYLEESQLYGTIDLAKPWDDPANSKARERLPDAYRCRSADLNDMQTTYLCIFGPDSTFAGSRGREIQEIADGTENTIAVVDAPTEHAVHWMSPNDISPAELLANLPAAETHHQGIIQAACLDGHVSSFSREISPKVLRGMLTIAGGEEK